MNPILSQQDAASYYHVHCYGEGEQTLVLAHGFGCDQQIWQALLPLVTPFFRVVCFDYAGCGQSDPQLLEQRGYRQLADYVEDLNRVVATYAPQGCLLLAHSISGAIGMQASMSKPQLYQRIITIGPTACYLNDPDDGYQGGFNRDDIDGLLDMMERNYFDWAGYLAPQVMANLERPEYAEVLREKFLATNPLHARRFAEVTFFTDIRPLLPQVTVPVDILYCQEDIIVPITAIDYLAAHLPQARRFELAARGHYPHISAPAAVAETFFACLQDSAYE